MLYAIVAMLVIILDQGVKYWVTNHIMLNTVTEPLIPGVLSLVRMHNDGAAFSFLAGGSGRVLFIVIALLVSAAVFAAIRTGFVSGKAEKLLLTLLAAGGLSNGLDRIFRGYVVDMFDVTALRFPIFNFADIVITVSCLLFVLITLFQKTPD